MKKKFKRIYIEITNICNLSCSFCPTSNMAPCTITLEQFQHIIDEIHPYTDYIYFHVKGEPLTHCKLGEFIEYAQKYDLFVNITTNGTLLDRVSIFKNNYNNLRQMNISIHSYNANSQQSDIHSYLDKCIYQAKYFSKYTNTITAFRLWNLNQFNMETSMLAQNKETLDYFKERFSLTNPIPYSLPENTRGIKLDRNIYLNFDYEFDWPDINGICYGISGRCHGLIDQIAILSNGSVVPCCLDQNGDVTLGNIFTDNFSNILDSTKVEDIVSGFKASKLIEPLCQRCGYATRFHH